MGFGTGEGHGRVNHCGERGAKTAGLEMTRECLTEHFHPGYGDDEGYHTMGGGVCGVWGVWYGRGAR